MCDMSFSAIKSLLLMLFLHKTSNTLLVNYLDGRESINLCRVEYLSGNLPQSKYPLLRKIEKTSDDCDIALSLKPSLIRNASLERGENYSLMYFIL